MGESLPLVAVFVFKEVVCGIYILFSLWLLFFAADTGFVSYMLIGFS